MATTGDFWNVDDPSKPWGPFDPDAEIVFPIYVTDWLTKLSTTYASHSVIAAAPLECVSPGTNSGGTIGVRIRKAASAEYVAGTKYPFTLHIVGADGQKDDRTFWLKLKER